MPDQSARRHDEAQHLAFDRTSWEFVRTNLSSPGAGAVHDLSTAEGCFRGSHARGAAVREIDRGNGIAGRKIYAAIFCCLESGGGEGAGIDRALFEIERRAIRVGQAGLQLRER